MNIDKADKLSGKIVDWVIGFLKNRKLKKLAKKIAKEERIKKKLEIAFHKRATHVKKYKEIQKTLNEPLNDELKDMEILGI